MSCQHGFARPITEKRRMEAYADRLSPEVEALLRRRSVTYEREITLWSSGVSEPDGVPREYGTGRWVRCECPGGVP